MCRAEPVGDLLMTLMIDYMDEVKQSPYWNIIMDCGMIVVR